MSASYLCHEKDRARRPNRREIVVQGFIASIRLKSRYSLPTLAR